MAYLLALAIRSHSHDILRIWIILSIHRTSALTRLDYLRRSLHLTVSLHHLVTLLCISAPIRNLLWPYVHLLGILTYLIHQDLLLPL